MFFFYVGLHVTLYSLLAPFAVRKGVVFREWDVFSGDDPRKWYPDDGGWGFHVASTVSEWVCAAAFNFFMLTLVDEFKSISMDPPQVKKCCLGGSMVEKGWRIL